MSQENATSLSLLERAREQDAASWRLLVQLYGPLVRYWCQGRGLVAEDAEDVLQEVFLAVSRGLDDFQRQRPGSFRSWIRAITHHKCLDRRRRRQREVDTAEGGSSAQARIQNLADAEPENDTAEVTALYQRALDLIRSRFEERTWQAFWQAAVEGRSADVVAADLGMSAVAVRIAKSRVLACLREQMQGLIE